MQLQTDGAQHLTDWLIFFSPRHCALISNIITTCLQCHHLLEEHEDILEQWFFKHYANGVDLNLEVYFCIDKLLSTLLFNEFYVNFLRGL